MRHRKAAIALITAGVIGLLLLFVYFRFYYIDTEQWTIHIGQGAAASPDGEYMIKIDICPVGDLPPYLAVAELIPYIVEHDMEAYVVGYLWFNPTVDEDNVKIWSDRNRKIIYFDQYDGSALTFAWADASTVEINGVALEVPRQTFDYRRQG